MNLLVKIYYLMGWDFKVTYKCISFIKYENTIIFDLNKSTELLVVEE